MIIYTFKTDTDCICGSSSECLLNRSRRKRRRERRRESALGADYQSKPRTQLELHQLHKLRSTLFSPRDLGQDLLPSLHAPRPLSLFRNIIIQPSTGTLTSIFSLPSPCFSPFVCFYLNMFPLCPSLSLSDSLCLYRPIHVHLPLFVLRSSLSVCICLYDCVYFFVVDCLLCLRLPSPVSNTSTF